MILGEEKGEREKKMISDAAYQIAWDRLQISVSDARIINWNDEHILMN